MSEPISLREALRPIVHDLNGELFVIRGHAELGLNAVHDPDAAERHFECVMRRCDEVILVINRLRDLGNGDVQISLTQTSDSGQSSIS